MAGRALIDIGLYYYFLPTYTQGKKIIWDGITNEGRKFLDYIPEEVIENQNGQEMKIVLKNGSIIQVIGTDNYDAVRGTNPRGCVFSEYAYQNPMAWEVVRPILKINGGWAVFNTTPNGKNHSYELDMMARNNPGWFTEVLTIENTGLLDEEDMKQEKAEGMDEEMIAQEYYCSYNVGIRGSYYAKQIEEAIKANRIGNVPIEKHLEVDLFLDLGKNDTTAIGFVQQVGKEIRIIDSLEARGEEIAYYCIKLGEKGYRYRNMYLPHDAYNKRLESSKSIQQQFEEAGFKTVRVPDVGILNGIQEVRKTFSRLWIDKERCKQMIRALENYHKEYDNIKKVFKDNPVHDWSSNFADMVRYLAIGLRENHGERSFKIKSKYNTHKVSNSFIYNFR
jgi:hypothetical protein